MDYFVMAHYGKPCQTSFKSIELLEVDRRIVINLTAKLHAMRQFRNRIVHGPTPLVSPEEASAYAQDALSIIGLLGDAVPDDLAIESGAAHIV